MTNGGVCSSKSNSSDRMAVRVERTGIQFKEAIDPNIFETSELFKNKIEALEGIDQVLAEKYG